MLSSLKQLTYQFNVMFFFTLYISIAMFWIYFWWVVRIFYFLRAIYQKRQLYIYTPSLIFILFLTIYWLDYLEVVCETSKQEGVFFIVSNNFISFLNVFTYLWLVRKKKFNWYRGQSFENTLFSYATIDSYKSFFAVYMLPWFQRIAL